MPVLADGQEAEIGRFVVPSQHRQKCLETISMDKKLDVVMCACHPSDSRNPKIRGSRSMLGKK
jgi:hypothetical protein